MAKSNVRFYIVDLRSKYDALATKDSAALYWIEETQQLYKGSTLFAVGATAVSYTHLTLPTICSV